MFQWDQIRYFVAVARGGSVSRAAAELGVNHATALRQIGRLEQSLGVRLFEHRQTGYRITPEGQDLLRLAQEMEANAVALARRASGQDNQIGGELSLVLPDPSVCNLLPLLQAFRADHPAVVLRVVHGALGQGPPEVDIEIRMTDAPPEALVGRQLARLDFAPLGLAICVQAPRPQWILWQDPAHPEDAAAWQHRILATITRTADIACRVSSHTEALAAARAGLGVALLAADTPDLALLRDAPPIPARGLWLLTHPDLRRAGRVRAFMAFAAAHPRFASSGVEQRDAQRSSGFP